MALATSTANITLAAAEAAERPQGLKAAAAPLIADLCLRPTLQLLVQRMW